jgi:hypothetical protein
MDYIFTNSDKIAVANASLGGYADSTGPYTAIHQAVSNVVNQASSSWRPLGMMVVQSKDPMVSMERVMMCFRQPYPKPWL